MLQNKSRNVKVAQCLSSLLSWKVPDISSTKLAEDLLEKLLMSIKANQHNGKKMLKLKYRYTDEEQCD